MTVGIWPITLWGVFPLGAWLGCWLPARVRGRPTLLAGARGLLTGIVTGLVAGLAIVACLHAWELCSLISERHSGGYASYRVSVIRSFLHDLWPMMKAQALAMGIVVTVWALRDCRHTPASMPVADSAASPWTPRFSLTHMRIALVIAGGLAVFGGVLVFTERAEISKVLVVAAGALGTVVIGPWMGPLANPGASTGGLALRATAIGLPLLMLSLVPFRRGNHLATLRKLTLAWCGYITAILFWVYLGIMVLGHSLG